VSFGPKDGGSALTGEVLLDTYGMKVEKLYLDPKDALEGLKKKPAGCDGLCCWGAGSAVQKTWAAAFDSSTFLGTNLWTRPTTGKPSTAPLYDWTIQTENIHGVFRPHGT